MECKVYPSDSKDASWQQVQELLPPAKSRRTGATSRITLREESRRPWWGQLTIGNINKESPLRATGYLNRECNFFCQG